MPTLQEILAALTKSLEEGDHKTEEEKAAPAAPVPAVQSVGQRLIDIIAEPMTKPLGWQTAAPDEFFSRGEPIGGSADLDRILALPRRTTFDDLAPETKEAMVEIEMQKYSRFNENCRCKEIDKRKPCIKRLKPIQAFMLREISMAQGLLAHAPVGIGKCVRGETEFLDYKTGKRRRADELGELKVAGFDKIIQIYGASAFASGSKECVRVRVRNGYEIELSTDHPVLTHRGWVPAGELLKTDYVATALKLPEPEVVTTASDEEVKFVAYMLSDGGCSDSTMSFTNADSRILKEFTELATHFGYAHKIRDRGVAKAIRLNSYGKPQNTPIRDRWDLYGLSKSKRAHKDTWGLPNKQLALFLNRFYACDGHVSKSSLEIVLASERLIDDIKYILSRLGIASQKRYREVGYTKNGVRKLFDAWELSVTGGEALKFLDQVGVVFGKEEASIKLKASLSSKKRNSNLDVVPVGGTEFKAIFKELGSTPSERRAITAKYSVNFGQCLSRQKFNAFCSEFNYRGIYSHLATTDVFWSPVTNVTPTGVHPVFDLTVPGPHNFVANGMVVHNTVLNILSPLALTNVRTVMLCIPSSLRKQLQYDYLMVAEHYKVPNLRLHYGDEKPVVVLPPYDASKPTLHVIPYSRLSLEKESDFIQRLNPDAIICDEVDAVRNVTASRRNAYLQVVCWRRYTGGESASYDDKVLWLDRFFDRSLNYRNEFPFAVCTKRQEPSSAQP